MSKQQLIKSLQEVLADTYALYLKTHNYHWNVTGPNFKSLHELFEIQYTDLATAIDVIAERIRALDAKVPASFTTFNNAKSITDGNENNTANDMVKELSEDQQKIAARLHTALKEAQNINDEVTIGLITERLTVHEKNAWMLKVSQS